MREILLSAKVELPGGETLEPGQSRTESQIPPEDRLTASLTPERRAELIGNSTIKKFKVVTVLEEIDGLQQIGFPLPSKEIFQDNRIYKELLYWDNPFTRVKCLEFYTEHGSCSEEQAQFLARTDEELNGPLQVPEEVHERYVRDNPSGEEILEKVKYVYQQAQQSGLTVHPHLPLHCWWQVFGDKASHRELAKIFEFAAKRHNAKFKDYVKKKANAAKEDEMIRKHNERLDSNNHLAYTLGQNSIHMRFRTSILDAVDHARVINEFHDWGQPIVVDLGFVKHMGMKATKSLMFKEINFGLKANRESKVPFAPYFTEYNPGCKKAKLLATGTKNIFNPDYPVVVSSKSFTELFDRKRLVYLSPDSRTDLLKYDPDDVYIIGGIIGDVGTERASLSKAKKLNIRHARLPLKRFVGFSPELNVDTVWAILAEFKNTQDWFFACRWIPPRLFRNILKGPKGYTLRMESIYLAQRMLTPMGEEGLANINLTPKEYRRRYKEFLDIVPKSMQHNLILDGRYDFHLKEVREKAKFGFLESES